MVQQAARGGDQDVYTAAQLFNLRAHANAAKHHHRCQLQVFAVQAYAFFNLRGQLAGRRHDQAAHGIDAAAVRQSWLGAQTLQHGQHKGRCFARAGLRAAQQVTTGQNGGDGLCLDGGGGVVALLKHGFQDGRGQIQFFKGHGNARQSAFDRPVGCSVSRAARQ